MAGAVSCSSAAAAAAATAAAGVSRESRGRRRSSAARSGRCCGGERERSSLCLTAAQARHVARSEKAKSFFGCSTVLARNDRRAMVMLTTSGSHGGVLPRAVSAMDRPAREGEGGGEGQVMKTTTTAMAAAAELAGGVGGKAASLAALAAAIGSAALLGPDAAHAAAQATANVALTNGGVDTDTVSTAIAGGGALAAIAAALSFADPEKRRKQQASEVGGDDMDVVRNYFNSTGFDRWRKIYGETDDVNKVQFCSSWSQLGSSLASDRFQFGVRSVPV
ncbi:hypothetical protein CBR_g32078 [Chara braunii]|uniref:Uncharacterized protein n=1 Tax=Chara braunii TaxID=69332 RepID=A0A388LGQ9_CHABU|nr:hypothetical protein CBR_g32078 [Chara braunii]|eukprot:GBG81403.1 hypothetical protein CBR_g32078 [Chara braunii]